MIRHQKIAITASAQRLNDVVGITANSDDDRIRWVQFQPAGANGNPVFLGGAGVTTAEFGFCLPAGSGGIPSAPYFQPEGPQSVGRLSDWYFIGTASQSLHVTWMPLS